MSKEDEVRYLEEAQKLCDRVNAVEKSLGGRELSHIPLPKPLEEFSWVSIGLTLIELHKYVSDNNMVNILLFYSLSFFNYKNIIEPFLLC